MVIGIAFPGSSTAPRRAWFEASSLVSIVGSGIDAAAQDQDQAIGVRPRLHIKRSEIEDKRRDDCEYNQRLSFV
jgi:hypothetical protein